MLAVPMKVTGDRASDQTNQSFPPQASDFQEHGSELVRLEILRERRLARGDQRAPATKSLGRIHRRRVLELFFWISRAC